MAEVAYAICYFSPGSTGVPDRARCRGSRASIVARLTVGWVGSSSFASIIVCGAMGHDGMDLSYSCSCCSSCWRYAGIPRIEGSPAVNIPSWWVRRSI